jgi:tetratricopeptide (TPR) repeat protein
MSGWRARVQARSACLLDSRILVTGALGALLGFAGCRPPRAPAGPTPSEAQGRQAAALVVTADSLAAARRYEDAATRYAAALLLWPDSVSVAKRALGSFWRAARYEDAYLWGRRALAREPRSLDVLFDLGVTCGFLVALECVDSTFRRAIELDSSFVDGYGELGFLAQARGDLAEAVRFMEAAYAVAPENDFAVSGLAQMLIPAGQPARARAVMAPRLAVTPRARAYGGRSMRTLDGWALLELGDTAGASAAFEQVLGWLRERERAGQTTYQLYRERAAIYALRGERDAAVEAMRSAFDHGWRLYGSWSLSDPMFAGVARDPAVTALVERMRADVRATRRRLGLERKGE